MVVMFEYPCALVYFCDISKAIERGSKAYTLNENSTVRKNDCDHANSSSSVLSRLPFRLANPIFLVQYNLRRLKKLNTKIGAKRLSMSPYENKPPRKR